MKIGRCQDPSLCLSCLPGFSLCASSFFPNDWLLCYFQIHNFWFQRFRLSCVMSQAHTSSHLQGRESDQLRPCQTATSCQRSCGQSLVPRYKQILKTILCIFVYERKGCEEIEQLLENGEYHCNVERGLYSLWRVNVYNHFRLLFCYYSKCSTCLC